MSNYRDFVSDFPSRCGEVLTTFTGEAQRQDREVTLMLAVATSGFVVPFERLRCGSSHPSRDRQEFVIAAGKLDEVLEQRFLSPPLWDTRAGSWVFTNKIENVKQELDSWPELLKPKPMTAQKRAKSVLKHLRNALAHGNIFTRGNPIEQIVFLSRIHKNSDEYKMLAVHPADFRQFLQNWFSILGEIRMPRGLVEDQLVA